MLCLSTIDDHSWNVDDGFFEIFPPLQTSLTMTLFGRIRTPINPQYMPCVWMVENKFNYWNSTIPTFLVGFGRHFSFPFSFIQMNFGDNNL